MKPTKPTSAPAPRFAMVVPGGQWTQPSVGSTPIAYYRFTESKSLTPYRLESRSNEGNARLIFSTWFPSVAVNLPHIAVGFWSVGQVWYDVLHDERAKRRRQRDWSIRQAAARNIGTELTFHGSPFCFLRVNQFSDAAPDRLRTSGSAEAS
jgi:hypothetical protein